MKIIRRYPIAFALLAAIAISLPSTAIAVEGEKIYRKCKACHDLEAGKHKIGPSLAGVVGRQAGTAEGFTKYKGLTDADWTWMELELMAYLEDPTSYTKAKTGIPSSMTLKLKKEEERKAVIDYLKNQ